MALQNLLENPMLDNNWQIYRHGTTQFLLGSSIKVNEGQIAVFMNNDNVLCFLGPGLHTLSPQNIPQANFQKHVHQDGNSIIYFKAMLFFVNTSTPIAFHWKSNKPIALSVSNENSFCNMNLAGRIKMNIFDYGLLLKTFALKPNSPQILGKQQLLSQLNVALLNKLSVVFPKMVSSLNIPPSTNLPEISSQIARAIKDTYRFAGIDISFFVIEQAVSVDMVNTPCALQQHEMAKIVPQVNEVKSTNDNTPINYKNIVDDKKYFGNKSKLQLLKIITGILEAVLALPFMFSILYGYVPYSTIPIIIALGLHIWIFIYSRRENKNIRGSVMGIIVNGSILAVIPFISSLLRAVTSIFLLMDGFKKEQLPTQTYEPTKSIHENKSNILKIVTGSLECIIGIVFIIHGIGRILNGGDALELNNILAFPYLPLLALHLACIAKSKGDLKYTLGHIIGIVSCTVFSNFKHFNYIGHLISGIIILYDVYKRRKD